MTDDGEVNGQDEKSSFVVVPSTKSKTTREVETQTENVPTFGLTVCDGELEHAQENDGGRRPSISHRRNFSLTLSPRTNQEFQLPQPPQPQPPPVDPENQCREQSVAERRMQRKTSMPSRPSDLRLLFSDSDNRRRRVIDGRNIGDANELSFERNTEEVVENFMVLSYERDVRRGVVTDDEPLELLSPGSVHETPLIPELERANNPLSPISLVARKLVLMADDMDRRHGSELDNMVQRIIPNILAASTGYGEAALAGAFDVFRDVASKLFEYGEISWSRIVALMSFGYRMGVTLFRQGVEDFVKLVVRLVTKYILLAPIRRWIVQSGGWFAALTFRLTNDSSTRQNEWFLYLVWGTSALLLASAVCRYLFK